MADKGISSPRSSLTAILRERIQTGEYAIGGSLPTEKQLCEEFGTSRYSTRKTLQKLSDEGLIVRRTRSGSTVIAKTSRTHLIQRVSSIQEILNYGGETERKNLSSEYVIADEQLASRLRCDVGTSWFRIKALRYLKGSPLPLCHTDIYLAPEYAGVTRHKKHGTMMIIDQISELYGQIAESTHIDIYAGEIDPEIASCLQAPPGASALNVIRRYCAADDQAFEITISVHPAERHTYSFLLKREHSKKTKG
ncbi:MAG: GntR family transcriptional regulator [Pusillimonas sp.]